MGGKDVFGILPTGYGNGAGRGVTMDTGRYHTRTQADGHETSMGLRGMRVRKSPLVRVLYAEATRPFPVNAKGAGPQTTHNSGYFTVTHKHYV